MDLGVENMKGIIYSPPPNRVQLRSLADIFSILISPFPSKKTQNAPLKEVTISCVAVYK